MTTGSAPSANRVPPEAWAETPDPDGAYPRLSEQQIGALAPAGERRTVEVGDVLYSEGSRSTDLFVILHGLVATIEGQGRDERVVGVHGPGRFLGEIGLLTGEASFVSAIAVRRGEVLAVPVRRLRDIALHDPTLGDLLLRAFMLRRSLLIGLGAGLRIVGSRYSADTRRLRDFAARNRLPHRWVDVEHDEMAEAMLKELGVAPEETPVVVLHDRVLRNPSNAELARAVGMSPPQSHESITDVVVVGAGPAGLAASVYAASEGLATITLDRIATGGQAALSSRIENYLGFPAGISGAELAERATIQATKFGSTISVPAAATELRRRGGDWVVGVEGGAKLVARTIVLAAGVSYRKLPVPRLEELEGTSIYYAATEMEANVCRGDPVAVVGGGNSAGQASVFLARHAPKVRLIVREDDLAANMSRYLINEIERTPGIDILLHSEVRELIGERMLEALVVEDTHTGERQTLDARALFCFIGADPHTEWLGGCVELDDGGYVLTGRGVAGSGVSGRERRFLETSQPGIFAAGDIRSGSIKRVASAVGEGAISVRQVHEYLEGAETLAQIHRP